MDNCEVGDGESSGFEDPSDPDPPSDQQCSGPDCENGNCTGGLCVIFGCSGADCDESSGACLALIAKRLVAWALDAVRARAPLTPVRR